ncbi:COG4315 family predicted lipoprotein [Streptomyces sp. NPDC004726]
MRGSGRERTPGRARTACALAAAGLAAALVGGCSNGGGSSSATSASPASPAASSPSASPASPSATAAPSEIATRSNRLGRYLVDGRGLSLYHSTADTSSESTCEGDCAKAWPPLILPAGSPSPSPSPGSDVRSDLLGTTTRPDGSKQVTYNGHPLYLFTGDKKPGETNGQNADAFGAKWYILDPAGNKIVGSPSGSPGASTSSGPGATPSAGTSTPGSGG